MNRMKKSDLQRIFGDFNRTHCAGEGEGAGGGSSGDGVPAESVGAPGNDSTARSEGGVLEESTESNKGEASESAYNPKTYLGSKKVNPEQRPLKAFARDGMSKAAIDALIREGGKEIFLTSEEIKEIAKKEAEEKAKKGETDKKEKGEDSETAVDDKKEVKEKNPKDFYEETGLDEESFNALSEKTQEKIVSLFEKGGTTDKAYKELEEKHISLQNDTKQISTDSVISARLEEIRTGRAYVATEIASLTNKEYEKIDELVLAGDKEGALKLINDYIKKVTPAAVAHERGVIERQVQKEKLMNSSHEKFLEIAKISKGKIELSEKDHTKIVGSHKEVKALNEMLDFFTKKKGYTLDQIANKHTASELYSLYAISRGWDKERDKNIANNSVKSLLDKLRNPTKVTTLDPGERSTTAVSAKAQMAASEQQMIDEVANGNFKNLDAAIAAAEGRPSRLATLSRIRDLGIAKRNSKKR
jgi:hypothetical protein